MKIAVVSHVRFPIAMPFMGGMESHSWQLVKALEARGHDVHLFASGDSDPGLPLHPICERHHEAERPWDEADDCADYLAFEAAAYERAMAAVEERGYDVVHNNCLHPYPVEYARRRRLPMVTSLHTPPFPALAAVVEGARAPWLGFTATSRFHARQWNLGPDRCRTVHNGIDLVDAPFFATGNGRAVWAGRIVDYKAPHLAIAAARRAGIGLDLYGPVEHGEYFAQAVAPRLDEHVRYHGAVDSTTMRQALGAASVLLFTPLWEEPFGLVAVEALSGGTPVAAFDRGAVREVIGPHGIYVAGGDDEALAAAIPRARELSRRDCAAFVRERYDLGRMIAGYEACYAEVAGSRDDRARRSSRIAITASAEA